MTLTTEQIMQMQAGPEMNAAVAELVMRWHQWVDLSRDYEGPYPMFADWGEMSLAVYEDEESGDVTRHFSPSTDIAAAWLVVEEIGKRHTVEVECVKGIIYVKVFYGHGPGQFHCASDDSAPLAISRAALLVLAGRQEG
jgi:hypothetical protein